MSKVAVVTGGVRRLGRRIAFALADDGYELALIYNSSTNAELAKTKNVLSKSKVRVRFYKCDVSDVKSLKRTVEKIGKDFGKIDLLVNNAGIFRRIEFGKITEKDFDSFIDINLKAAMFATQSAVKFMKKGCVINIASLGGIQNWTGFIPYSISKAGLIKLTALLAKTLAPKVRVNAIAPGTIIIEDEEAGTPDKISADKIPLKRYGKPEDITEAVRFILKCEYLTGQTIVVDGGRMLN